MQKQAGTLQGLGHVEQDSGCGHPGGGEHHRAGDVPPPGAGLALHPVLHVQTLQGEEEKEEEEEEGPEPAGPLGIIAAPRSHLLAQDQSADQGGGEENNRLSGWSRSTIFSL